MNRFGKVGKMFTLLDALQLFMLFIFEDEMFT